MTLTYTNSGWKPDCLVIMIDMISDDLLKQILNGKKKKQNTVSGL